MLYNHQGLSRGQTYGRTGSIHICTISLPTPGPWCTLFLSQGKMGMNQKKTIIITCRVVKSKGLYKTRCSFRVLRTLSINRKEFIGLQGT